MPSVVAHKSKDVGIVVADNASNDDSLDFLRKHYPDVRIISLEQNLGYAGGYNAALEQIDAAYYVLANNDLEMPPGCLEPLLQSMEAHSDVAAISPKVLSYRERNHFEYAGAAGGFIDAYGMPFCRGRIFNHCEEDRGQYQEVCECFWATGAFVMLRADAFRAVGGFDEELFAHMEEIDLCWRLKNRGYRILCNPNSSVYHLGGGTLSQVHARKTYLNFRNSLIVSIKNDPRKAFAMRLLIRMLLDGLGAIHLLFSRGPFHFVAVLRAHFYLYRHFGSIWRKRKAEQRLSDAHPPYGLYTRSIALSHFFRKRERFDQLESSKFIKRSESDASAAYARPELPSSK